jgi:hypothetical protein
MPIIKSGGVSSTSTHSCGISIHLVRLAIGAFVEGMPTVKSGVSSTSTHSCGHSIHCIDHAALLFQRWFRLDFLRLPLAYGRSDHALHQPGMLRSSKGRRERLE